MRRREFIAAFGSAAAAWPFVARAQQSTMPIIGFLSSRSAGDSIDELAAFRQGLTESGYDEGRNVIIESLWAEGHFDKLSALAEELVRRPVSVLAAVGGFQSARAAQAATTSIPIVFAIGEDPVKVGLVSNINRPDSNLTGATFATALLGAKRLGLLRELGSDREAIGLLVNEDSDQGQEQMRDVQEAAQKLGQRLIVLNGSSDQNIDAAFASLARQHVKALLVGADPFFDPRRNRLIALVAQHAIPAMYQFRAYTVSGGLMSYGASITNHYKQVGIYVGRVLRGDKPADLPVLQPTKFELIINLQTAKTLGLIIPSGVMAIADEVIE